MSHRPGVTELLLGFGLLAFLIAGLSIVDMFLPRPYDGVVLESDAPGRLTVRQVVPGSGAERAGIRPGDRIVGIDRNILRSPSHAAKLLNEHDIGSTVPYLVRRAGQVQEVGVDMGRRRIGSPTYLYACLLGFAFFFVGVFVLRRQPRLRPAQIFFLLCSLFLLFLVCRLRPASYSWVDGFVLGTGTLALLFLPASFLHFFLIFPQPLPLRPQEGEPHYRRRRLLWLVLLGVIYLVPPLVLLLSLHQSQWRRSEVQLISGAPVANWWLLALYIVLGLAILAFNVFRLDEPRQRRGALLVLIGAVFGLIPFLVTAVAFPSILHTEQFLFYGVAPLILVPLTFAYAIIRFQMLDIRVILQKSLLYTLTTAVVTALYALGITLFNYFASGSELAASPYFPIVFALAIVLLFEPLRRRIQVWVDRFFFAERRRLERAIKDLSQAVTARVDLAEVVREVVVELPEVLQLHFAGLYLARGSQLAREAGPTALPFNLPLLPALEDSEGWLGRITSVADLAERAGKSEAIEALIRDLETAGVEVVAELASPRRSIGLIVLSGKRGQMPLDPSELELLDSLVHQVAMTLETSLLLEERTRQAEIERDLEIAASVQSDLLPSEVSFAEGWTVAALCRPARHVGGDFFTELPGPRPGTCAMVYGDVAGKSVSGALMMMAAHEALHSLAMSQQDPEVLFDLANQRLYRLGNKKSFVALAYLTLSADERGVDYLLAGQPQPLIKHRSGAVTELELPAHRLPLGALVNGGYRLRNAPMQQGEVLIGYSDGVVDALSPDGDSFGIERLYEVVARAPARPDAMIDAVVRELSAFTKGSDPYDDVTLVAISCDREEH